VEEYKAFFEVHWWWFAPLCFFAGLGLDTVRIWVGNMMSRRRTKKNSLHVIRIDPV
jgi:hypothetical protein